MIKRQKRNCTPAILRGNALKVIQPGFMNKEGICIQCPYCQCIYEIESSADWNGEYKYVSDVYDKKFYDYATICPECGCKNWFGLDSRDFPPQISHSMMRRDDWEERYKMPIKEIKLC